MPWYLELLLYTVLSCPLPPQTPVSPRCSDGWISIILMKYIEDTWFRNPCQNSFCNAIIRSYGWIYVASFRMPSWKWGIEMVFLKTSSFYVISQTLFTVCQKYLGTWKLFKNSGGVLIFTSLMIQPVSVILYCSKWKLRIHLYLKRCGYYLSASFHWKLHCFFDFWEGLFWGWKGGVDMVIPVAVWYLSK